ncbi:hypothetical protein [Neisseria sp. Ec49-e6-T10]|uniref:hypothetical protein n=1 Tax=Neisseria sp. Ec49-e6-T10 TaxID=3140744 RepID=UPI003EC0F77B
MSPFALTIKPSKIILIATLFCHLNCVLIWWFYFSWILLGLLVISISLVISLKQIHWFKTKNSIDQIWFEPRHTTLFHHNQTRSRAILLPNSMLSRFLCVLSFRDNIKTYSICIFPNNTAPEEYRQLMAFARWCKQTEQTPKFNL